MKYYFLFCFMIFCAMILPVFGQVDIELPFTEIQKSFFDVLKENLCIGYFVLVIIGGEFVKKININIPTFVKIGIFGLVSGLLAYLFTPCKNGFHLFFTFSFAVVCYEFILSQVYKYLKQFNVL